MEDRKRVLKWIHEGHHTWKMEADISVSRLQDGVTIDVRSVPKHVSSLEFIKLVPGHAYTVTVQSRSGKLTNNITATGRTGKTPDQVEQVGLENR